MDLNKVIQSVGIKVAALQPQNFIKVSRGITRHTHSYNNIALKVYISTKKDKCQQSILVPHVQIKKNKFRLVFYKRKSPGTIKYNKRIYSNIFNTKLEAERSLFDFRLVQEREKRRDLVLSKIENLDGLNKPLYQLKTMHAKSLSYLSLLGSPSNKFVQKYFKKRKKNVK